MIYICILILLLFLSYRFDICRKKEGYKISCYFVILIFILLAGLRWRLGLDTPSYLNTFYKWTPRLDEFRLSDLSIGDKPLWRLLNSVVYTYWGRFYVVQLIQATFVNILVYKYIAKHTDYVFTCLFFYFAIAYYGMNMESMKAAICITICLFAFDFVFERKWLKAYLLFFIAIFFHPQAILFLLTPFFIYLRFNRIGIIALIFSFLFGLGLQYSMGDYLEMLNMMDDEAINQKIELYTELDRYSGQTGSILRVFVTIYVPFIFLLACLLYYKRHNRIDSLQSIEPYIMLGAVFMVIQMNSQIFYRYVAHFQIYFIILYTHTFVSLINSRRKHSYMRIILIFIPFLLAVNARKLKEYHRFYPYSSIFDKTIDKYREFRYSESGRPVANINEY